MPRRIRLGWNSVYDRFFVTDDKGATELPKVTAELRDGVQRWQDYLLENFVPEDTVVAGRWAPGTRWWFAEEAHRLQREFALQVRARQAVVIVDQYPALIPISVYSDHGGGPLWGFEGGLDVDDLPISDQLRVDLAAWERAVVGSGFPEGELGKELIDRLQAELGPEFCVS
jgi:hypothetical protein